MVVCVQFKDVKFGAANSYSQKSNCITFRNLHPRCSHKKSPPLELNLECHLKVFVSTYDERKCSYYDVLVNYPDIFLSDSFLTTLCEPEKLYITFTLERLMEK